MNSAITKTNKKINIYYIIFNYIIYYDYIILYLISQNRRICTTNSKKKNAPINQLVGFYLSCYMLI